jgi:thymidine kinase
MATLPAPGDVLLMRGPMFSGKTEALIEMVRAAEALGKRVWVIKPRLDDRHGEYYIGTHSGHKQRATGMNSLLAGTVGGTGSGHGLNPLDGVDYLFIDEAHFFTDVREFINRVNANHPNVAIVIAALKYDYLGRPWPSIVRCSVTDKPVIVKRMQGTCERCGAKSSQTTLRATSSGENPMPTATGVLVAGSDRYMPVCKACFKQ